MGKRGKQPWSRTKLPAGIIRIRRHSKRTRVRMIKVRDDGPISGRWIALARWWWLNSRGPIPPGMRIVHRDGDLLNDDPSNYMLATADDVLMLSRQWDPTLDERNHRAAAKGTAKCNVERSRIKRALAYLPTRWYPVDVARRIVINRPFRSRRQLGLAYAAGINGVKNGADVIGAWLGWAGMPAGQACILAVLSDGGPAEMPEIQRRVNELRDLHAWGTARLATATYYSMISALRRRDLLHSVRLRSGRNRKAYLATEAALAARGAVCPYVAARGDRIEPRFAGFRKVWPENLSSN